MGRCLKCRKNDDYADCPYCGFKKGKIIRTHNKMCKCKKCKLNHKKYVRRIRGK